MNQITMFIVACLLAGCGAMNPVKGAPEVMARDDTATTVSVQPDGSRLVIVNTGETVRVIILPPPAKEAAPQSAVVEAAPKITVPVGQLEK